MSADVGQVRDVLPRGLPGVGLLARAVVCRARGCVPAVQWVDLEVLVDPTEDRWAVMQVLEPTCSRCRGWAT
ncbi:hypothetical protein MHY85_09250 [Cellulomonas sp. ACRRI]|uniref:hypothetical protein n=1 Tax=Cellulomonas sp. ACRRI TaxID=2918188 RepID=UPI001EF3969D|nr:hypothetical protein [Cellulomonas sp. ACRRI]MCG7286158.1 hypothetical protein [Cellulomonas sp. ACRRI]